jgi:hypothetical protein
MTKKTSKKTSKKTTRKRSTKPAVKKKVVSKTAGAKESLKLRAEDIRPVPHLILTGEIDETIGIPKAIFKGKYTPEEQEVLADLAEKLPSRNLKDLAKKAQTKKEDGEVVAWLEEQTAELTNGGQNKHKLSAQDILEEFDKTLTRGMYDKDSLDAMMTHGTIESLEKAYGEAQSDLLKAQRKAMVLKMIVSKAHELLSDQALTFLAK